MAPRSRVMAVVKADGYGHGLERVARALDDADAFGVASIAEGERIRAIGLANRIVVLTGIDAPGDLSRMASLALEPVIHHESQLALMENEWSGALRQVPSNPPRSADALDPRAAPQAVWLKFDTGMHRLGFASGESGDIVARVAALPGIGPVHLMTHLANSDVPSDLLTSMQMRRFDEVCAIARTRNPAPIAASVANSAAVLAHPASHCDWVRTGGLLYGISAIAGSTGADHGFEPAMTLTARIIAINTVEAGEGVGYGHAWRAKRPTRVGVLAVGYADGYPRSIRPGTGVQVRGVRADIIGRVSMDLTTIDLTDLPAVEVGEAAVLWGRGLPVEEVASSAATIGYELVCGMTRRVEFIEDPG